jgi:hypothetical protein
LATALNHWDRLEDAKRRELLEAALGRAESLDDRLSSLEVAEVPTKARRREGRLARV